MGVAGLYHMLRRIPVPRNRCRNEAFPFFGCVLNRIPLMTSAIFHILNIHYTSMRDAMFDSSWNTHIVV